MKVLSVYKANVISKLAPQFPMGSSEIPAIYPLTIWVGYKSSPPYGFLRSKDKLKWINITLFFLNENEVLIPQYVGIRLYRSYLTQSLAFSK